MDESFLAEILGNGPEIYQAFDGKNLLTTLYDFFQNPTMTIFQWHLRTRFKPRYIHLGFLRLESLFCTWIKNHTLKSLFKNKT